MSALSPGRRGRRWAAAPRRQARSRTARQLGVVEEAALELVPAEGGRRGHARAGEGGRSPARARVAGGLEMQGRERTTTWSLLSILY